MDKYNIIINNINLAKNYVNFHKTEYTIKKVFNKKLNYNYGNVFYEKDIPRWISINLSSVISADGEYNRIFVEYSVLQKILNINKENLSIIEAFYISIKKNLITEVDYIIVIYILYLNTIYFRYMLKSINNKVFKKISNNIIDLYYFQEFSDFTELNKNPENKIHLCLKSIPLSLNELKNIDTLKSNFKKELFINYQCTNCFITKICPFFGILIDWKIIKNKDPEMYTSRIIQQKLTNSAKYLKNVKVLYKMGNNIKDINHENIINKLYSPINYIEKYMIYSNYHLLLLLYREQLTLYNFINLHQYLMHHGIFKKIEFNKGLIFQLSYSLLCLNEKLGCMHCDLHLNNITLESLLEPKVFSVKIDNKYYNNPSICKFSIIDFGRSVLNYKTYIKYFINEVNEYEFDKKKILGFIIKIIPHFYEKNSKLVDSLLYSYPDQVFKLFSGLDLLFFIELFIQECKSLTQEIIEYYKSIINYIYKYIKYNLELLDKNPNTEFNNIYYEILTGFYESSDVPDIFMLSDFNIELTDVDFNLNSNILNLKSEYENLSKSENLFFK